MSTVSIAWNYTTAPLVRAALGGFHVYPVDDLGNRLADDIEVDPDAIPTQAAPLTVPMPAHATRVEVASVETAGAEGLSAWIHVTVPKPPVPTRWRVRGRFDCIVEAVSGRAALPEKLQAIYTEFYADPWE